MIDERINRQQMQQTNSSPPFPLFHSKSCCSIQIDTLNNFDMAKSDQPTEEPSSEEILKVPQTNNSPNNGKGESVDKIFRRPAIIAHCFGLFPCSSVILKDHAKHVSPHYLLIPTTVSVILYISAVIGSIFGLLLYMKEFHKVENYTLGSTDRFALKTFLCSLLISRAVAPQFCIRKAKAIALVIQKLARYDKTFQIKNHVGFINLPLIVLLIGSVINAVANTCVAYPVMNSAYKGGQFLTMFRLFGVKSPKLEFLHAFSGGFYGEIGLVFLSSTTLFIGRVIIARIQEIQNSLFHSVQQEESSEEMLPVVPAKNVALAAKKMKILFSIKQDFEEIFGTVMVMYVGFSTILLVTTFYTITSFAVYFHSGTMNFLWNKEFLSIISVVILTCFRLKAFVEGGEKMAKAGKLLSTRISFMNPSKCEKGETLTYLQRVSDSISFSFNSKGYFIMNRRLIPSILGAVVSFTVVLAQFRDADLKDQWQRQHNTTIVN